MTMASRLKADKVQIAPGDYAAQWSVSREYLFDLVWVLARKLARAELLVDAAKARREGDEEEAREMEDCAQNDPDDPEVLKDFTIPEAAEEVDLMWGGLASGAFAVTDR
jgi:hypothetical protein